VDCVYGHQKIARENVAASLERKMEEGLLDADEAIEIARMLFYDNPKALFCLKDIGQGKEEER
jgi:hypothetical protein